MPPESFPWDRRDFRKYERSAPDPRLGAGNFSGGGGGGPYRWREQHYHPYAPPPSPYHHQNRHQPQQQRWYSDFRSSSRPIPPGHGKQGAWQMYTDEPDHGFIPFGSRYGDRNIEDGNYRPFGSRGDVRHFRNMRDTKGSCSQRELKAPSWEPVATPSGPGRPTTVVNNQRSLENTQMSHINNINKNIISPIHPLDSADLLERSQTSPKEQHDNNVGTAHGPAVTAEKVEKENVLGSTDWKPLKWPRSGSLTSRSSSFSYSSSSKSIGVESIETEAEVKLKNVSSVQLPSVDATACVTSPAPMDEVDPRKKPRLGWGEGLAKFEKKKVEGPEDQPMRNGLVVGVNDTENVQSHTAYFFDKSSRVASLFGDASPATPSSVACSSSPGIEEKDSVKVVNVNHDTSNSGCLPSNMSLTYYDGPILNLENLELCSIANLSNLIHELLQTRDSISVETGYVQTSTMNKMLLWKADLSKTLEITESEIDSLETELKSMKADPTNSSTHPASSSSLPEDFHLKPCEDHATPFKFTPRPAVLQVVSSGDMIVENTPVAQEDKLASLKDPDFDSPGSATSKFVDMLPAGEDILLCKTAEYDEASLMLNEKCSENGHNDGEGACSVDKYEVGVISCSEDFVRAGNLCRDVYDTYYAVVVGNKDHFTRALEELNKLLPAKQCQFDIANVTGIASLHMDFSAVKENYLTRKRFLQFKENVVALKFKAFQHFWKEGRTLSVRKLQMKSHKKFDISRSGHKKNRLSSRCRNSSSAGSHQAVTADEVIEFVNGLLSEMPSKTYRNTLKMPALVLDKHTKMSRFLSNNCLVEDPCAAEEERSIMNQWTSQESQIFIDKFATFGKDFKKIASFLDNKTIADCIEFYYKNHKSECFEKARNSLKQKKPLPATYLVSSGKIWNREPNSASLDMLGAASAIAANNDNGIEIHKKCTSKFLFGASNSLQKSESIDMCSNEREAVAADVLAGICGSISSEAMSSCITSSIDPGDGNQDWRCQRGSFSKKRPLTIEVTQNIDDECFDESCEELDPTDWTDEEKSMFIQAVSSYGKDFVMISQSIRTRSRDQCKVFFGKARKCLGLDLIIPGADNVGNVDGGGGSDIEDACDVEIGSVICNELAQNLNPDFKKCEDNTGTGLIVDSVIAEPVLVNSPVQPCQVDKPFTDVNIENKEQNSVAVKELGTVVSSNPEVSHVEPPIGSSKAEDRALTGVSDGHEGQRLLSPDNDLHNEKVEDKDTNSSEAGGIDCTVSEMKSECVVSDLSVLGFQKKTEFESCPVEKPRVMPLQQNGHLPSVKSSTLYSVPIEYYRSKQHLSGNSLSDPAESLRIFEGCPISVQTMKEITEDVGCKRSAPFQNAHKRGGILHSDRLGDFSLQKCSGSRHNEGKGVEARFPSQEQSRDNSRPKSAPSSSDKPFRNGDVKLFGKILVPSQEVDKSSCHSLNLKFHNDQKVNLGSDMSKLGCSNYISLHNDPVNKSCGFLNGNIIQTGFSALPDSTLLRAKYPVAFSNNYIMSTAKLEQHSLHGVVPSRSVSVFPSREVSSSNGVVTDYLRNVQPFTLDMKRPQEVLLSEMQRRSGFTLVSGMQQQRQGMVGINVGVSDPVAAIKMHYANAGKFSMQVGNIIKEDGGMWKSNGDVGR